MKMTNNLEMYSIKYFGEDNVKHRLSKFNASIYNSSSEEANNTSVSFLVVEFQKDGLFVQLEFDPKYNKLKTEEGFLIIKKYEKIVDTLDTFIKPQPAQSSKQANDWIEYTNALASFMEQYFNGDVLERYISDVNLSLRLNRENISVSNFNSNKGSLKSIDT
ncbi:hypothetical protein DI09_483p10, partial [Mitosporidium daphniae]